MIQIGRWYIDEDNKEAGPGKALAFRSSHDHTGVCLFHPTWSEGHGGGLYLGHELPGRHCWYHVSNHLRHCFAPLVYRLRAALRKIA